MTDLTENLMLRRIDAERRFAAAAFVRYDQAIEQCGWLKPELFMDEAVRVFWREMLAHGDNTKAANEANIFGKLLLDSTDPEIFYGPGVLPYAEKVASEAWLYNVGAGLPDIVKGVAEGDMEATRRRLNELAGDTPQSFAAVPDAADIGTRFLASLEQENQSIMSGIGKIDYALGGFWKKNLYIICARPGVGKTAIELQCARNAAAQKQRVLFQSLEMSADDLWARMACGMVRIPYRDVIARRVKDADKEKIKDATHELMELYRGYLYIDDTPNVTSDQLWQRVASIKPDIVFTDHLRLFADKDKHLREDQRLGLISWNHKRIAKEFDVPIVAAAQLNRNLENRSDKEPTLSDLRDSGQIEENADVVLAIHRESKYVETPQEKSPADVLGLKFRNGPSSIKIRLTFDGLGQWFDDPQF